MFGASVAVLPDAKSGGGRGFPGAIRRRTRPRVGQQLVGFVDVLELQGHSRRRIPIGIGTAMPVGRVGRRINLKHRVIVREQLAASASLVLLVGRVVALSRPDLVLLIIGENLD